MRKSPNPKFVRLLEKVFDDASAGLRQELGTAEYAQRRRDFVFHMTDWTGDLEELWALSQHPEKFDVDAATVRIIGCLYHIIPHIKAAGRLLLETIPDAFEQPQPTKPKPALRRAAIKRSRAGAR
jgi:hypothetical protein